MNGNDHGSPEERRSALGADLIIPVLAIAFTTYYLISTAHLVWEAKANGVVIGILLYALIAIQLARIFRRVVKGEATLGLGELVEYSTPQKKRIALLVLTAFFVVTLPWLGVSLGLFLTMLGMMWVLGDRDWRSLLGVSLATTAAVYVLFVAFLGTRLPTGPVDRFIDLLTGAGS